MPKEINFVYSPNVCIYQTGNGNPLCLEYFFDVCSIFYTVKYVLDSSALFSMQDLPEGTLYTVSGVISELKKYKDPRIEYWDEFLEIRDPSNEHVKAVEAAAMLSGDDKRLSPVDKTVIALAKETGSTILTDDYSIQNTAKILNIPFKGIGMREIKEVITWTYKCTGCFKIWEKNYEDCPVCGSPLKSVRSRKR